jgi:hypothetical protein
MKLNRRSRRSRRAPRPNPRQLLGSTRAQPFTQFINRRSFLTVAGATNYDAFSFATVCSDLAAVRMIKIDRISVRYTPVTSGATTVQLQGYDVATSTPIPLTRLRSLSHTNQTTITARYPFTNWTLSTNTANAFLVALVTNVVTTLYYDLEIHLLIAIDNL